MALASLHQKAVELLNAKADKSPSQFLGADDLKLIHELEVHQMELELQNEELLRSQSQAQGATEKYAELFDSAPTGYFTLSAKGEILEVNLSGAAMLGKPSHNLKNSKLVFFITTETRPVFNHFLDTIFLSQTKETCEVTLLVEGRQPIQVLLVGTPDKNLEQCLLSVVDLTERNQAAKALLASEQKYRLLLESSEIGLGVYSLDGKVLYYNQRALHKLGGKADDFIGKSLQEIFGVSAASVFVERIQESAQSEKSIEYEEFVKLDSGEHWFLSIYSRLKSLDDKVFGVQVIAHDITERKQSEEALRTSTQFANSLITSMHDGVSVLDTKGIHIDVNPAFCLMTGFSREELLGNSPAHLYWPPEEYGRIEAAFQKTLANETGDYELVFMRKNGERFPVIVSPFAIRDKFGNIVSYSATIKDISERKQAENRLQQSEHNLAEAERIGNTGSWEYDVVSDTATWSENMFRIFEVDSSIPKELVFKYFADNLVHPDDRANFLEVFQDALAGRRAYDLEYRILKSGNTFRYIHALAEVIRDADGKPVKMIGKVEDITERKRNEEALKESKIQLELAHRAAGAGTWDWDMISGKLTWSKELFALFGLDPEKDEASFDTWTQAVHPDDRTAASDRIENAIREKTELNSEYRVVYKDGQVHWISSLGNTICNEAGQDVRMTGICTDITQRKQSEFALKESERLYRSLFENMLNSFAFCKMLVEEGKPLDFIHLAVNNAFELQTGLKNVVGKKISEVIPGIQKTDPQLLEMYKRVAFTGKAEQSEMYIEVLKMWVSITAYCPEHEYFVAVFDVINERKRNEEALLETNAYLENLVNYANAPIIVWDPQLCITRFNPAFEALTGLKEADVLKKSLKILFPPALADKSMELIQKTLSGERWETVEIEILHLDGSIRTVLWNSATLFEPDGKTPIATIAQGQEITRRKHAEKVLETQHALLISLLNSPKDIIIFSLDKNYCYTAFNEKHREEMKRVWNADIEAGTNILDCMHIQELKNLAKKSIDRALKGEVISEIQHQPEPDIYYEFNWNPIWLNEEVDGVTVFIRDITERRKEEEHLKESLILLRIAEDLAKIGGWSVSLEDNRVKWSDEVAAIHEAPAGYSPMLEEGINFYAPEFRETIIRVFSECAEKGIPYNEELQIITMKGKRVWVQSIGEAVRDENGNIFKIQGAFQDITERKKAEEDLYALSSRQEALLTSVPDIIMEVDNTMKYTWTNRAGKVFFGNDVIGNDASYYFEGEQETYDLVQPLFKGDENIIYIESWQRRKDGQKRLLAWWCRVLKDEIGTVTGALSTARDITEQKLAQEALQKSEERYRSLLTNLDAGIVVHSPDTSIIMNNRKASELLGLNEDQMKGRMAFDPGWKFVNENRVPLPIEEYPVNQVAATRMPFGNEILGVIRSPGNDLVWLTVNGFPVFDAHGKLLEILISFIEITERKKAEEALRLKNLVFDASIAANSIAGIDGNITEVNDSFLRLWGFTGKNEVLGKPILYFINDADDAAGLVEALNEKEEWEGDYTAKRKDGSTFIAHSVATSLKDINGNLIGYQSAVIDITERKHSEEALRESEQKFRDTVTFLDEGYYCVTFDGVLLEHNQAFNRLLGFDKLADLRGTLLPDFWLHPEEREAYLQEFLINGSVTNYQIKAKTKTGEIITVLLSSHLVRDAETHPLKIEGVFIDITERIRNEESLHRLTKRLQNLHLIDQCILKATESPVTIVQSALQHVFEMLQCQRTSVGIFDFDSKEVRVFATAPGIHTVIEGDKILAGDLYGDINILDQNKMEVIEDLTTIKSPSTGIQKLIDEGIRATVNVALFSAKGLYGALNIRWDNPRIFSKEDLDIAAEVAGEISIAIEQARLLNETKRNAAELEQRVIDRTAQLEESNKELEAFSYSVSHDLRAPLRHISGFVDLLTKSFQDKLPEPEKHYLDTIADSAHQMGILIDDLLQFSRTGRQEMKLTELDMNIALQEAIQGIKHDVKDRSIKWEIAMMPLVYGDFALLRLVWLNLLSNAVKFTGTKANARIEIGFNEGNNEFEFFVRDNGVGFDMHYAGKLFGVFQRLHSSHEFEGTGIGLANVRRIILRHGGRTWAESGLNKGAVFYFSIPKQAKPEVKEMNNI